MEIIDQNKVSVTVRRDITIEVGRHYRINPSYGYAGIDPAVVEVMYIGVADELPSKYVEDHILSHIEATLSLFYLGSYEYQEQEQYLHESIWVVYRDGDDTYVLPLEDFVDHISRP